MDNALRQELETALRFYVDHGVETILGDDPIDRFSSAVSSLAESPVLPEINRDDAAISQQHSYADIAKSKQASPQFLGKSDARAEAVKIAQSVETLAELKQAINDFDGMAIKRTATNMVFSDGNPDADIMLIGEAPGADEDRTGKPFVGVSGQLLDKIFATIDVYRDAEDVQRGLYISNIINWRPPGNRTPSPAEIEISLPFIERHIQIVRPKVIILCGGVAAKSLLGRSEGISRLRKKWHDYTPQTDELSQDQASIPALATYHPSYLLRTPAQKKATWADMLMIARHLLKA